MFWFSFGNGGMRQSTGCLFLPFFCVCGSLFMFDNFRLGWLLPMIALVVVWLLLPTFLPQSRQQPVNDGVWEYDKPKRDIADEKPKRGQTITTGAGDVLDVVEPREGEEENRG
jgi:hypothetical protein